MRTFKTRSFLAFRRKGGVPDAALCRAVLDANKGLIAADPGGGVIKQRIARESQGKSSGFRTLIVFRAGARAVFVHGFAKSEQANIGRKELVALRKLAGELLAYDERTMAHVVASGTLGKVNCDETTVP